MSFIIINHTIQKHLIRAFALLDGWFDRDPDLLSFKAEGESSIAGLIRCIALNNHHLLQMPRMDEVVQPRTMTPYNLDLTELEHAARQWRRPLDGDEEVEIDLHELRATLRQQLETSLLILERAEAMSSDSFNPLACAESDSWDGFHRLYFMGLLMRQYIRRFREIHEVHDSLIPG